MEVFGSLSMPSLSVPDVQNRRSTVLACARIRDWSKYFVKKMNQLPTLMMSRRPSTVFETRPPRCATSTSPYGLLVAAWEGGLGAGVLTAGGAPGAARAAPPRAAGGRLFGGGGGGGWVCRVAG